MKILITSETIQKQSFLWKF